MPITAANNEVMRFVLPASTKERFQNKCARRGQNMSERMRYLVARDVEDVSAPAERLSAILSSAREKNAAAGLAEPTIEDIDAFIDSVRFERIEAGLVS